MQAKVLSQQQKTSEAVYSQIRPPLAATKAMRATILRGGIKRKTFPNDNQSRELQQVEPPIIT